MYFLYWSKMFFEKHGCYNASSLPNHVYCEQRKFLDVEKYFIESDLYTRVCDFSQGLVNWDLQYWVKLVRRLSLRQGGHIEWNFSRHQYSEDIRKDAHHHGITSRSKQLLMEIRYPEKSGSKLLYSILKMLPQCLGSLPKYNFNLSVGHRTEITYACIQLWSYKIGFVIINCVILTIYTIFGKLSYWIKNLCFSKNPILCFLKNPNIRYSIFLV